jgi:hypothetical protein
MKAILDRENPNQDTMTRINEYELQIRIAEETLKRWIEET